MQVIFSSNFQLLYINFFNIYFLLSLQPEKDKRNPLSHAQQEPSCLPSVRNPFKAPGKDKDSEWRKMQAGGLVKKLPGEACPPAEGSEACQKENVSSVAVVEKEDVLKSKFYQSKDLPPGMKLKKKVSDTEESIPKVNGVEKLQEKEVSATAKTLQKDSDLKKSTDAKTSDLTRDCELTDPTIDKALDKSSRSRFTQASKDSITSVHTSGKPSQSTDSHLPETCQDDDDDDVVLVSVKTAAQKSPATAVQKTLTTYPGFQPSSKIKSQNDPRGLRGLLTAQLQQKKVSVRD